MIPVLGIPILNRGDLLTRLLNSIDFPVKTLFIVNNGNDEGVQVAINDLRSSIKKHPFINGIIVLYPPHNLGCSASWNKVITSYPNERYWTICANDIAFGKGDLEKIYNTAEKNYNEVSFISAAAFNSFVITPKCLKEVGYFDENFYPAYLEDGDYWLRVRLSKTPTLSVEGVSIIHGEPPYNGSSTIYSSEKFSKANATTHHLNSEYYIKKWGGVGGQEAFTTPFGDPTLPLHWWKVDNERKQIAIDLWK